MPGSIHVSVLEAFDLPEAVADSEDVAIKVAIGSREYQTTPSKAIGGKTSPWNLDFDFPVMNLRDNFSVTLLDAKGEAISKNEIDTPSIVEKGSFDVNLLLNGGGSVHVNLSFVLTDEERRRIDVMRAAALKRREQEALKLAAANTQSASVQGESEVGSSNLQSSPAKSLEKEKEKDRVPKDGSATASQEALILQNESILEATQEDISLFVEQAGKLNKEPTGIADSTEVDNARTNQDTTNPLSMEETNGNDQKPDKSDISPIRQEEVEELADSMLDGNLNRTSSGVKAKIKAFEKTRPQSGAKQNHTLSPSRKIQKFSPHNIPPPREKAEVEEEQVASSNHDIESRRMKNEPPQPTNQMEGFEHDNIVPLENVGEACETRSAAIEQNYPAILTHRPEDNEVNHTGSMGYLKSNERGSEREVTSLTAQKQFPFGDAAQGLANLGIQDNDLGFQAAEAEQPRDEEARALPMQGSKNINLVSLSKQVLSGAVSGAVVIAACALLWAARPKRRNSTLFQKSKQRKRK